MARKRTNPIAESLARVSRAARGHILRSESMSRTDRERLTAGGYLQPVIKGWYLLTTPEAADGESTAWFASFWEFVSAYLDHRFGEAYCLSAETSMQLHLGATSVPSQIIVIAGAGGQSIIELPFKTSLLTYEDAENLPDDEDTVLLREKTLRAMSLPLALARIAPDFFSRRPHDADIALRLIPAAPELTRALVKGGYVAAAERLIGAYEHLGDKSMANWIADDMLASGYTLRPVNPFQPGYAPTLTEQRIDSPYAARLRAMWHGMREPIRRLFIPAPGRPESAEAYVHEIEEKYESDAYNSLSIEGYRVTPELIARMRSGEWDPANDPDDRAQSAALAAKGYSRAFKLVKTSILQILAGEDPGLTAAEGLHNWYRALFSGNVDAGLIASHDLIGYRRQPVYIKGSLHVPPPSDAVPDCMNAFFDLLQKEADPAVRAVLGHFTFVFIHPYMDGNGRLARFLLNAMLAAGGYPWTIVPHTSRRTYMQSLETASVNGNIEPFATFLSELVAGTIDDDAAPCG
ncbi:MAG: Fic family protein [Verrucomicrobia bacterium]|nr:Fic family protein [Verrucomicrobiota bacterium]